MSGNIVPSVPETLAKGGKNRYNSSEKKETW